VEVGETLPQGAAEQETLQVTPFPAVSFRTLAVNCAVVPDWTLTEMGETETEMGGAAEDPPPQPELLAAINARNGIATGRVRLFQITVDLFIRVGEQDLGQRKQVVLMTTRF
jgi:hypothetical protein